VKTDKALVNMKKKDLTLLGDDLAPYFDALNKLDDKDQIHDVRCKFCNSKLRVGGEAEWERVRVFKRVTEWFQKNGENMNINNVRVHIMNHYMRQEQLIMRRHYAERLLPIINYKINKSKRIETLLAMLEDKAWKYASIEHTDDIKAMKSDEMLVKIIKETTNLIKMQAELTGELDPIKLIVERFQQIFVSFIGKVDDPKLKLKMVKELEDLKEYNIIDM